MVLAVEIFSIAKTSDVPCEQSLLGRSKETARRVGLMEMIHRMINSFKDYTLFSFAIPILCEEKCFRKVRKRVKMLS